MITREEASLLFKSGWNRFLDIIYTTADELRFCTEVKSLKRRYGMLSVQFEKNGLTEHQMFILESIEYKIERLSVHVCETCGEFGRRRTDLTVPQTLCTEHYALQYSEEHPTPSLMAHQEPHTDY